MHALINKQGKVVFKSSRKIDVIYEHQKYFRRSKVRYVYLGEK